MEAFYNVGVARSILAYNEANRFADGCHEPRNGGLSAKGYALVERMDKIGMRVDLTHCSVRTTLDVLEMNLMHPPIFSHSNAQVLYDHERNITDHQIRALASAGGYIGVNGVGFFLGANSHDLPCEIARHIAHIASITGAERVGLGFDFMYLEGSDYAFYHNNKARWPRGYPDPPWNFFEPEQLSDLVVELLAIGFSQAEIKGILGDNYIRLVMPGGYQ